MHNISFMSLLLILVAVLVLFGRGKISSLMGELGEGITAFKNGLGAHPNARNADAPRDLPKPLNPQTSLAHETQAQNSDTKNT